MLEALFGLIGVLVGSGLVVGYNYLRDRTERQERYRLMLYDKCLEVHQEAFYHVQQLLDQIGLFRVVLKVPTPEEVKQSLREAWRFYDSNCLYLQQAPRNEMALGLIRVGIYLQEPLAGYKKEVLDQLRKAREATVTGIGMKHLEEALEERREGNNLKEG